MANVDLAALKLASLYSDRIAHALRENSKLLQLLDIKPGRSGASNGCSWIVDGYGGAAFNFTEGGSFASTETADSQLALSQAWARVGVTRKLTGDALRLAAATGNPMDNVDLMVRELRAGSRELVQKIGDQLFSGDGTSGAICGLEVAIDDGNTYGGLNRATVANEPMRSYVADPGSPTSISLALIRADISGIEKRCGRRPTLAVVSFEVMNKIAALFDSNASYQIDVLRPDGGKVTFNAGYDAVRIHGCTFVADGNCTANAIYYLNPEEVCLRVVPGLVGVDSVVFPMGDDGGAIGLPCTFVELPADGDFKRFGMHVQCQLEVSNPAACGVRLNVSTS